MFPNGGGGATHVATKDGLLKDLSDSRDSIIIVAGGGAGAYGYISNDPNSWWHGNSAGGYIGGYSYEKLWQELKQQVIALAKAEIL